MEAAEFRRKMHSNTRLHQRKFNFCEKLAKSTYKHDAEFYINS